MAPTYEELEKEHFDLQQLLEISKSLSSKLDLTSLLDSILYICMGQMRVTQAALFARDNLDTKELKLTRNQEGFALDRHTDYNIAVSDPLCLHLVDLPHCLSYEEYATFSSSGTREIVDHLKPSLIIPLVARGMLTGIIFLGERIDGSLYTDKEKAYLMDIARLASTALYNAILFEMSTTDMMTHLKFRHYFTTVVADKMVEKRESLAFSIIMLDIDHFKDVNDTYGHKAGDEVIQAVSGIILGNLRHNDLGVRYGGEEFLVYLEDTSEGEAEEIAERLRKKVSSCHKELLSCTEQVTISAGVAAYAPEWDKNVEACIHRADVALYHSKHNGRNRTSCASEIERHGTGSQKEAANPTLR
jgi:two-component system, cell cycle response regulator